MAADMIVLSAGLAIVALGAAVWAFRPAGASAENQIAFLGLNVKLNSPALAVMALGIVLVLASASLTGKSAKTFRTSFDCRLASGRVEEWICGDELLAGLDIKNANLFNDVRGRLPADLLADFEAQRKSFVDDRRICPDKKCVEQSFRSRIQILQGQLDELKSG